MDADNEVNQQLDDHMRVLMQTLRPQSHETNAGVKGGCAAEGACNRSGTSIFSHARAVESARFCKTEPQSGINNPPPAAHALHCDAEALGLPFPSPLGDESLMSPRPAPQNSSLISQGHQWEADTSPCQDENVPQLDKSGTDPYERLISRGAHQQLQALHHIDRLQRAGMERRTAEVSKALVLMLPPHAAFSHHVTASK